MTAGSGVDLVAYPELPERAGVPAVLFAGRLLRNKGVGEFVTAARIVAARGVPAEFLMAGTVDPGNPQTLTEGEIDALRAEGLVAVLGQRSDMAALIAKAHIVAFPAYYGEGIPKILIEAAACGRAVVTTDHPGCRDAIVPGETGLLVPPRDGEALADVIAALLADDVRRRTMGRAGRRLAVRCFGVESVIASHLAIYRELGDGH
jgi:glycosyltransferase involved in cell wall biosynthesis